MKNTILVFIFLFISCMAFPQQEIMTDNQGRRTGSDPGPLNLPVTVQDAGNAWVSVGPFGGDVADLAVDPLQPSHIFAAAGTPFTSFDDGQTWTQMDNLLSTVGGPINGIEAAGNGILIATGTYLWGKIARSTDGGATWQSKSYPVNIPAQCIAMDPNDTNTIYVGLASITGAPTNKVIVKSVNGGLNWTALDLTSALPVGYGVVSICVDPSDSQTLFAIGRESFSNALVAASFDGGATWEDRTGSLPSGKPYNHLAIGNGKVYMAGGQLFGSQNVGVYETSNYGLTWTNISASFPNKVSNAILIDPNDPLHMFVGTEGDGIYSTADGGGTWNYTTNGAGEGGCARTLLFRPGSLNTVYAGYLSIAVCRSDDGGANWEYANNGIATLMVNDVEIDRATPAWVLAGFEAENSGGCYLSADTGQTWSLVTTLPGTRYSKTGVLADGSLVAWSNGPSSVAQEGLYKSTDHGSTWTNMGPNVGNLFETEIFALAASELYPGLIYIGGNNFGVNGWKGVIYRTEDGGLTWDNVYISLDDYDSFRYLYIDPSSDDQIIYAAMKSETEGKLLRSEDGGDTWNAINGSIPPDKWFGAVVCDPDTSESILASTGGYGAAGTAWISSDNGTNWQGTGLSLDTYSKVQDLAISPANTDIVYAASGYDGVWLSDDGGWNWDEANDGMPALNITAFSWPWQSSQGWDIFAATSSNSVFRTTLYDPASGMGEKENMKLVSVFPNPAKGPFNVILNPGTELVRSIEIYSITGMKIATLLNEDPTARIIHVNIDLPSGFYLGKAIGDTGIVTFRVVRE